MANSPWSTLVQYVLPEVINCPKVQVVNEIRRAAILFCRRTQAWHEDLDYLLFPAGVSIAYMDPPQGARICEVLELRHMNGQPFQLEYDYVATTEYIEMVSTPTVDTRAIAHVALKPTLASTGMPEGIMEDWGHVIAYGAIASLKSMRGREWEDMGGAQVKNELFEDGMAEARTRILTGGAKRSLRVRPRSFI